MDQKRPFASEFTVSFFSPLHITEMLTTNVKQAKSIHDERIFIDPVSVALVEQVLPDRDGKRCMFCLKTFSKTYEMSASDTKQRQEWTAGQRRLAFADIDH